MVDCKFVEAVQRIIIFVLKQENIGFKVRTFSEVKIRSWLALSGKCLILRNRNLTR